VKKFIIVLWGVLSLTALSVVLKTGQAGRLWASSGKQASPQEVQKPKYDYMSGILSRSTQPLGLKENPAMKKLLDQGPVMWAIRAGSRHVLD
jgi:hypothetical protein